jgi:ATP-dependent exoDNAse (exonuclease V) beta subunit
MCLHVLSGARAGHEPVPCAELALLTFTDQAASEMRARLRSRLDALARGTGAEPELRASFAALGRPFPGQPSWRRLRDEVGAATIGTFHGLCTQLLRRAPADAGVDPGFELLDEREGRRLLRQVVEAAVLERVQRGDLAARRLVTDLRFDGGSAPGLVEALAQVFTQLREEGLSPRFVQVADPGRLLQRFQEALEATRALARAALPGLTRHRDRLEDFVAALEEADLERLPALLPRLQQAVARLRLEPFPTLKARVASEVDEDAHLDLNLPLLRGAVLMAPHEAAVRELLVDVEAAHRAALSRRRALDFTGLLVGARDLLRDSLPARRAAQSRVRTLLVDEFQDTNRLQLELVLLLAERREGGPRPVSLAFEDQHRELLELPLEPAALAVVGDRKQAIYEFRGADVGVFATMAACLEREGGGRAFLQDSRRASPALAGLLNALFTRALAAEVHEGPARDFQVAYHPAEDDLLAVRRVAPEGAPLVRLQAAPEHAAATGEALRAADADAVARYLASRLGDPAALVGVRGQEALRPIRGGDVAVLFARFSQLEVYRQALVRVGVRHRVVRGRGFFGAQEVLDVASFLQLLASPGDEVSFAAVLRSPWVGLTDGAVVELALAGQGLSPAAVLEAGQRPALASPLELVRLERLVRVFRALAVDGPRLGLRALLRAAWEATGFRTAVAGGPFGDQALVNLDKLLELASAREQQGATLAAFAAELMDLAEAEPTEAQGDVVDALDGDAVTLCTVHQAKGLEWPVVVLPELFGTPRQSALPVRFDRAEGLGLRPPDTGEEEALASATLRRIDLVRRARGHAERLRLLYVAATRARDALVLGLSPARPVRGTWARDLEGALGWADVLAATRVVEVAVLPRLAPPAPPPEGAVALEPHLRRVRGAPAPSPREVALPVTLLQDFLECPTRHRLGHLLGLSERPPSFERLPDEAPAGARLKGTAAHRLLELAALESPPSAEALRALLEAEGLGEAGGDVVGWVQRFLASPFGRHLGGVRPERVHRELPFAVRLEDGPLAVLLRGQLDVLVEEDDALTVIDYKTGRPGEDGAERYRFQLECYALAARALAGPGGPKVRAAVVFLQEADPAPRFLAAGRGAADGPEARVLEVARALLRAQAGGGWATRPRVQCEKLHCGFQYRCHPPV